VLYDAVFLASDEILQKEEGRKAIIVISDGVDVNSKLSEKEAVAAAHRADTIIYSIRYSIRAPMPASSEEAGWE